ncbi:MAG: FtsW/RodA/SpoVE family cell cycle protein [Planctomycetota bacterium]
MKHLRALSQEIDWLLVLTALLIVGTGLLYLASASPARFSTQALWVALGLLAMVGTVAAGYARLIHYASALYAAVLALLVLVFFLPAQRGMHGWISLPGFSIQPSELAKVAALLMLARHLRFKDDQSTLPGLLFPMPFVLVPMAIIIRQPDLGTAVLLAPLLFLVLFASGARKTHLAASLLAGAAALVPMWYFLLEEYQKRRFYALLYPERYQVREAYQLIMAKIAIGSGELFGAGWGAGRTNTLGLLPERHTDFLFCVIAEEGGFARAAFLVLLYAVLVILGLHAAAATRDPAGRLVAVGASAMLGAQVILNLSVAMGLLPTTGVPLPLASYGGSSMVTSFLLVGLILSVGAEQPPVLHGESFTGKMKRSTRRFRPAL